MKVIKKDETVQKRVKFVNTSITRKVEEKVSVKIEETITNMKN